MCPPAMHRPIHIPGLDNVFRAVNSQKLILRDWCYVLYPLECLEHSDLSAMIFIDLPLEI